MCLSLLEEEESAKLKSAVFSSHFRRYWETLANVLKLALIISHLGSRSECEQTSPTAGFTKKKEKDAQCGSGHGYRLRNIAGENGAMWHWNNPPRLTAECYRERVLNQFSLNSIENEEISLGCGAVQLLGSTAELNSPQQSAELLSSPGSQT